MLHRLLVKLGDSLNKYFFFLFLFLSLTPSTFAIGLSPPTISTNFDELNSETFTYEILNRENTDTRIRISFIGSLAKYASASRYEFDLNSNSVEEVVVTINYPKYSDLDVFGMQRLTMVAEEISLGESGMAAVTAVGGVINIDIPIPGKAAEIKKLEVSSVEKGENTQFKLVLANKGTDDLINKNAEVIIHSPKKEKLETFSFKNLNILSGKEISLSNKIISEDFIEGKYEIDAIFKFSDEIEPAYKKTHFFIGSTDIILDSYSDTLTRGIINKIDLVFQSIWGSPLKNVRAELTIEGKTEKLPILDFEPFGKTKINAHPDVSNNAPEILKGELKIEVPTASSVKEKIIELQFRVVDSGEIIIPESSEDEEDKYLLLITSVIVLLILLVVLNIYLLSRNKQCSNNKRSKNK